MCINPNIFNGQKTGCRVCWQCRSVKTDNVIGRCLAEQSTATRTDVVTLTYGRDSEGEEHTLRSTLLLMHEPQKMMKRLRKAGYDFSYVLAGEYGERRGRAHWHCVFFWRGKCPQVSYGENFAWQFWPHGHSYWDTADESTMRYVAKYVTKRDWTRGQTRFSYSKRPALGNAYLVKLAQTYVDQGLVPTSRLYSFPGAVTAEGSPRRFRMTDAMVNIFLMAYEAAYQVKHGKPCSTGSEFLDDWRDERASRTFDVNASVITGDPYLRPVRMPKPRKAPNGGKVRWDQVLKHWYCQYRLSGCTMKLYYTRNPENGKFEWRRKALVGEGLVTGPGRSPQGQRRQRELEAAHAAELRLRFDT